MLAEKNSMFLLGALALFACLVSADYNDRNMQPGSLLVRAEDTSGEGVDEELQIMEILKDARIANEINNDEGRFRARNLTHSPESPEYNSVKIKYVNSYTTPAKIKIMGPYDSGTNYLSKLMQANNLEEHHILDPSINERVVEGGWKHWPEQYAPDDLFTDKDRLVIYLVRHPLSWFQSIKKATYDISCEDVVGTGACDFDFQKLRWTRQWTNLNLLNAVGGQSGTVVHFNNLASIWNLYYDGYLNQNKLPMMMVRYEDLLTQPEVVLTAIASALGTALDGKFNEVTEKAKPDYSRDFSSAYNWNVKKQFLTEYTNEDLMRLHGQVDQKLIEQFGYVWPESVDPLV